AHGRAARRRARDHLRGRTGDGRGRAQGGAAGGAGQAALLRHRRRGRAGGPAPARRLGLRRGVPDQPLRGRRAGAADLRGRETDPRAQGGGAEPAGRLAMSDPLVLAEAGDRELALLPALANRHGCITGATGTGKTVTVQRLAEGFSRIGVPVFLADVKGDLAGIAVPGQPSAKLAERLAMLKLPEPAWAGSPVALWDVWGEQGHPVRATISEMGPLLLGRLLMLNDTQEGVLALTFKLADDNGLLLLDLKDLRAMLHFVGENAAKFKTAYGNVSAASIGATQRARLEIDEQGGDRFFGEPVLDIDDLLQTSEGRGVVNVLAADKLIGQPRLYATFLLWLLAELFEKLPEVGDPEKPKLVFFFDEAHLLFSEAPAPLLEKVEQVVRLIRSKGVGVYFATQS